MKYEISYKLHIACFSLSALLYWIFYDFLNNAIMLMYDSPIIQYPIKDSEWNYLIILLTLISVMALIHELCHAVWYLFYGGKVKIGYRIIYAYTKETSKIAIEWYKFIVVLLAPVVIISSLSLIVGGWIGSFLFFFNFIGSTGDITMIYIVLKHGIGKKIVDEDKGFLIVD